MGRSGHRTGYRTRPVPAVPARRRFEGGSSGWLKRVARKSRASNPALRGSPRQRKALIAERTERGMRRAMVTARRHLHVEDQRSFFRLMTCERRTDLGMILTPSPGWEDADRGADGAGHAARHGHGAPIPARRGSTILLPLDDVRTHAGDQLSHDPYPLTRLRRCDERERRR